MSTTQRQLTDAAFGALLDAHNAGVPLSKINELVACAFDLDDVPTGPLLPKATDTQVNARVRVLGRWGAVL